MKRLAMVTVILLCCTSPVSAIEQMLKDYIQAFTGRWVCEDVADEDVEGYWSKGDKLRLAVVHTAAEDQSGVRFDWQVEKDGKVVGTAQGVTTWDPGRKCLRSMSFAKPGFLVESTLTKEGDAWVEKSCVNFPDGSQGTATATITASDDGKTHTNAIANRVDHKGQEMPDVTRVWNKASKNHEMLDKHLGWLIGSWTGKWESPDIDPFNFSWHYAWISDGEAIAVNIKSATFEGLSVILYDPSDGRIKMWGANSGGGNGQAIMRVAGDELVWTNVFCGPDGKMRVGDFSFIRKDNNAMCLKVVDLTDGKVIQSECTKK